MPEGDTIHRAARRAHAVLAGRVPDQILTPHPRLANERWPQRLAGRAVQSVDARGKHLFVRFEGGLVIHSHLRMTGAWQIVPPGARWRRAARRAWLVLRSGGSEVVEFDGPVLELLTEARARSAEPGPDILAPDFEACAVLLQMRGDDPTRPIGDALLDQRNVAGLGTIWRSEACFAAEIDPWRALATVSDDERLAILRNARALMTEAVGRPGGVRRAVYGRAGRPCPRCATAIRTARQGENARLLYWCPQCQR